MDLSQIGAAVLGISVFLGALSVIWHKAVKPIRGFTRQIGTFLRDWNGEDADPRRGVPERPGVLKRLTTIEHEVRTNGGGSLKDAVNRVADRQSEIREELRTHFTEAHQRDTRIEKLEAYADHYRTQAETAAAVLHEVGVEMDLPNPSQSPDDDDMAL